MPPADPHSQQPLSVGVNWLAHAREMTADNAECAVLDSARAAKAAGFDGVELPLPLAAHLFDELGESFWSEMGYRIRELGLLTHSVHGPNLPTLDADVTETAASLRRYARYCVALGVGVMVVHPTSHSHPHVCTHVPKLFERDVELSRVISDELGDSGVRLAIENLPTYGLRYLAELMGRLDDRDNIGVCFDTGHWNVRPEYSLTDAMGMLRERIVHLHLNDNHGLCDEHLAPGTGTFPWGVFIGGLPSFMWDRPWMVELSTPLYQSRPDAAERDAQILAEACRQSRNTLTQAVQEAD